MEGAGITRVCSGFPEPPENKDCGASGSFETDILRARFAEVLSAHTIVALPSGFNQVIGRVGVRCLPAWERAQRSRLALAAPLGPTGALRGLRLLHNIISVLSSVLLSISL